MMPSRFTSFSRSDMSVLLSWSEERGDERGGAPRPVGLDIAREHGPLEAVGDRVRQPFWVRLVIVHPRAGAVAPEPVRHVDVLLEVIAQRKVEEWPLRRRELQARAQA